MHAPLSNHTRMLYYLTKSCIKDLDWNLPHCFALFSLDESEAPDLLLVYILAPLGVVCLVALVISAVTMKRRDAKQQLEMEAYAISLQSDGAGDKQLSAMMVSNPFYDRSALVPARAARSFVYRLCT